MESISPAQKKLLDSLLHVTHHEAKDTGKQDSLTALYQNAIKEDADLAGRALVHLAQGSKIRDQVQAALMTLLTSPWPDYREAGRVMLLGNEVYETTVPVHTSLEPWQILEVFEAIREGNGLPNTAPRLMKNLAQDWVDFLHAHPTRWDGIAVHNRKSMRDLYIKYGLKKPEWVRLALGLNRAAIVYDPNLTPKLYGVDMIKREPDKVEKAKLVMQYKIPFRVAMTLLGKIDTVTGIALVEAMSPQEAVNSRAWVEKSGLLQIEEVKQVYLKKVASATKSVATLENRKSAQGTNAEVTRAVEKAKTEAIKKQVSIMFPVLFMVDKSGSMQIAIEVAIQLLSYILPLVAEGVEIVVVMFDTEGRRFEFNANSNPQDIRTQLGRVSANGGTAPGRALSVLNGFQFAQLVIITDGGENTPTGDYAFDNALRAYVDRGGFEPRVTMLHVQGSDPDNLSPRLRAKFKAFDLLEVGLTNKKLDYAMLDNLGHVLGGSPLKSLYQMILETPFPKRA